MDKSFILLESRGAAETAEQDTLSADGSRVGHTVE
jgi:hypothetical protein